MDDIRSWAQRRADRNIVSLATAEAVDEDRPMSTLQWSGGNRRKYRGKYPNDIVAVSADQGLAVVVTKAGETHLLTPKRSTAFPLVGGDIRNYIKPPNQGIKP